jgi:CO/xanthine dehydrogenase Mo-binding subunit
VGAAPDPRRHRRRSRPTPPSSTRRTARTQRLLPPEDPQGRHRSRLGGSRSDGRRHYEVPHQEHAYLQPEAATAYLDDEDRITVEIGGQWTYEDLGQICHALDLRGRVRVVYPAVGGAFGGREDMSLQIVLAAAVMKLRDRGIRRPVRSVWSREESIVGHHKRHRGRIHARLGATRDGMITAVEVDGYLDSGAYNYTTNKVLGNMHLCVAGPYEVPNARIDSIAVYTNDRAGGPSGVSAHHREPSSQSPR